MFALRYYPIREDHQAFNIVKQGFNKSEEKLVDMEVNMSEKRNPNDSSFIQQSVGPKTKSTVPISQYFHESLNNKKFHYRNKPLIQIIESIQIVIVFKN